MSLGHPQPLFPSLIVWEFWKITQLEWELDESVFMLHNTIIISRMGFKMCACKGSCSPALQHSVGQDTDSWGVWRWCLVTSCGFPAEFLSRDAGNAGQELWDRSWQGSEAQDVLAAGLRGIFRAGILGQGLSEARWALCAP